MRATLSTMTDGLRFHPLPRRGGLLLDLGTVRVHGLSDAPLALAPSSTHFVLVTEGVCVWRRGGDELSLRAARCLVAPDGGALHGVRGRVIEARGYRGLPQSGGPLEPRGRLCDVDGCSDTLRHSFATDTSALDVFAWRPDSDFGPTDAVHPMINRTRLL